LNRYDCVIVGGGPVGCHTASELAKHGHQVAVLEKNLTVGQPVCCTGLISFQCFKQYAIPVELVLRELSSASVYAPGGTVLHLARPEAQAVVIDRGAYNAHMARQAQENGADYLLGHRVSEIVLNPDGVILRVIQNGREVLFATRSVALACGFGSRLPQAIGLGKVGQWTVGAQVEVEATDLREVEIFLGRELAPGYFAWLVPVEGKRALAGLMADKCTHKYLERYLSMLQECGRVSSILTKPTYRGITLSAPSRLCAPRVMLIGDAAGQVKPLTGGGLYFGLLCADMASSALHNAIEKDDFSARRMKVYNDELRKKLGREIRFGWYGHKLFAKMSDNTIQRMAKWALRHKMTERIAASTQIAFDWHGAAFFHLFKQGLWPFGSDKKDK